MLLQRTRWLRKGREEFVEDGLGVAYLNAECFRIGRLHRYSIKVCGLQMK